MDIKNDGRFHVRGGSVIDTQTGRTYSIDYSDVSGLKRGTKGQLDAAIWTRLNTGGDVQSNIFQGSNWDRNVIGSVNKFIEKHDIHAVLADDGGTPQYDAFNAYYNNLYSLEPGTSGAQMLGRMESAYATQAANELSYLDLQQREAALGQARVVQQITDQIRSERMQRLRAGMSEAQIANQDMQMLMSNIASLNERDAMLQKERMGARMNAASARDQAYMAWLEQANQRGQVGAAMYASDTANPSWVTDQEMLKRNLPISQRPGMFDITTSGRKPPEED